MHSQARCYAFCCISGVRFPVTVEQQLCDAAASRGYLSPYWIRATPTVGLVGGATLSLPPLRSGAIGCLVQGWQAGEEGMTVTYYNLDHVANLTKFGRELMRDTEGLKACNGLTRKDYPLILQPCLRRAAASRGFRFPFWVQPAQLGLFCPSVELSGDPERRRSVPLIPWDGSPSLLLYNASQTACEDIVVGHVSRANSVHTMTERGGLMATLKMLQQREQEMKRQEALEKSKLLEF